MSIFQGIIVLNGLSNALFLPKAKKLQFVQSFSSFKKEIKKKEQIHFFSGLSLTLSALRAADSRALYLVPT